MLFGKKKKVKQALATSWRSMEVSCENNYKDLAQEGLKEFEELLEQYRSQGLVSPEDYQKRRKQLEEKKAELKGYNHKQRIGW